MGPDRNRPAFLDSNTSAIVLIKQLNSCNLDDFYNLLREFTQNFSACITPYVIKALESILPYIVREPGVAPVKWEIII